jgi:TRAP-type mannitol/chloroaromatic compound transport system permease large subunit
MDASMLVMCLTVFGLLFFLLACGVWVGFALFMVGFAGLTLFGSLPAGYNMASSVWATVGKWEYVALPMFILMGEILYRSGISEKLFRALVPWLYRLPGGLLLMNIISCTLFAAVSGSSAAPRPRSGGSPWPSWTSWAMTGALPWDRWPGPEPWAFSSRRP